MAWPGERLTVKSLGTDTGLWGGKVGEVRLLGHDAPLGWSKEADALVIQGPPQPPGDFAHAVRITRAAE